MNVFQRKFVNEVRRCEEMDRKLRESHTTLMTLQIQFCKSENRCRVFLYKIYTRLMPLFTGFVEKEIRKANIPTVDTGENPEVPFPRDMIDLEVCAYLNFSMYSYVE